MKITERIGAQFGNPSGLPGRLATGLMNQMNRRQYQSVLQAVQSPAMKGASVLDIGFGNGELLRRISRFHEGPLYGVDPSPDMRREALRRCREPVSSGRMFLLDGDACRLPFPTGRFRLAYTVNTVYFWDSLERGLNEVSRVLAPSGVFLNAFYSKSRLERLPFTCRGFQKYTPEELRAAGEAAGFSAELQELKKGAAYCLILQK